MSALCGSLNNFSTSRFCTDASDALSLCNPRYTLYADGREDLLEMMAHGELQNIHPGCRWFMMLLGNLFCQSQKKTKPKPKQLWCKLNVFIPYYGTWNQIGKSYHFVILYFFSRNSPSMNHELTWLNSQLIAAQVGYLVHFVSPLIFYLVWENAVQVVTDTYFSKQWAAVRTHWGSIRVPPQKCSPKL